MGFTQMCEPMGRPLTFPSLEAPYCVSYTKRRLPMYHLDIPDMTCGHCVSTVEKAVKTVDPSASVAIDLGTKTVSIGSQVASDAFIASIGSAGYQASFKKSCCSHVA